MSRYLQRGAVALLCADVERGPAPAVPGVELGSQQKQVLSDQVLVCSDAHLEGALRGEESLLITGVFLSVLGTQTAAVGVFLTVPGRCVLSCPACRWQPFSWRGHTPELFFPEPPRCASTCNQSTIS